MILPETNDKIKMSPYIHFYMQRKSSVHFRYQLHIKYSQYTNLFFSAFNILLLYHG